MIDELTQLLERQTEAISALEARMRALELVVAAEEHRFLSIALEELETASERLAALELSRSLAFSAAGIPADASPDDLLEHLAARGVDRGHIEVLRVRLDDAREATQRLIDAHARATSVVGRGARNIRARVEAGQAFASV